MNKNNIPVSKKKSVRIIPLVLALSVLGACSLRPDYQQPQAPVASAFPGAASDSVAAAEKHASDIGWRAYFRDPQLQGLIAAALTQNRDLRQAALRIEEARGMYRIQGAQSLPQIDGTASAGRQRTNIAGNSVTATQYNVGVSMFSFELDFFGRVSSLKEAALHQYLATEEAYSAARIALIGMLANTYIGERALAERLDLAKKSLASRVESLKLAQQLLDSGTASASNLHQNEVLVESARVAIAVLKRQHQQARNALTLLVGQPLEQLDLPDAMPLSEKSLISDLPAGLPSDLLIQRPDIRAAEHRLIAANANIGAARAAFFPRISLTAGFGFASNELSSLFDSGSRTWSFLPQLNIPIFPNSGTKANLSVAEVRKKIGVAAYEGTIQVAFREVADALVARGSIDEQVEAQTRLLKAQNQRQKLAEQRYEAGIANFLEVLDARRDTFDAEQSLVQARQLRLTNSVDLYRVLGGGILENNATDADTETDAVEAKAATAPDKAPAVK